MIKLIRSMVGRILLFLDRLFPAHLLPSVLARSQAEKARIAAETSKLALYQFEACPFCIKTRRAAKQLGLDLSLRDVLRDRNAEEELLYGGGKRQVPCLRIEKQDGSREWMYESNDIINYLEKKFTDSHA